ncbi:hypothetical protein BSKO_08167 [Bryopsis sp. KO-2023]|nr:hypothetical protein BSKO_08167 [Bryopsis sp. KO-2023]
MKFHAPQSRIIRRSNSIRSLTAAVLVLLLPSVSSISGATASLRSRSGFQHGARRVLQQQGAEEERLFVRFTSAATDSGHVQVWTIDIEGKLWTSQRKSGKAEWSRWKMDKSISDVLVGVVAAPVGEKELQVWAINDVGQVWTKAMTGKMQKKGNPKWTEWTKISSLGEEVAEFIASHSDDGLLENWAISLDGRVRGRDKKPEMSWSDWRTVDTMNEIITTLVVSPHVSNKQRMWALDASGRMLMSKRLPVSETDRPWSDWDQVEGVPEIFQFVAAPLSTGHMYLWGVDLNGDIWASGEESLDNGAPYSEWFMLQSPGEPSIHISAATLPDGKLQLWIVDQEGTSWSLWETEDGFSTWTNEWQAS